MRSFYILSFSLIVATMLYGAWYLNFKNNEEFVWTFLQPEIQISAPKITSKEAEVNRTIQYLSHHTRMTVDSNWISSARNTLLGHPEPPSIPLGALEKSKGSLYTTVVPPVIRLTYTDTWQGYRLPVFTCDYTGRLANVLGEYSTMYALHKLYNVTMFIKEDMRERLKYFPYISIPKLPVPYNPQEWRGVAYYGDALSVNYASVELAAAGLLGPHPFVMQAYTMEIQLFNQVKEEIRRELTFSVNITTMAQEFLRGAKEKRKKDGFPDVVFIGFHVRRGDYIVHITRYGGVLPENMYYQRAINYYRTKFPRKAVFIASSDDLGYMKERFQNNSDIFFSPGTTPEEDMAVLNACNHSIVTVGSYGFFSGFLAGGEVVYPDVKLRREYSFSRPMYEKIGLSLFTPLPVD